MWHRQYLEGGQKKKNNMDTIEYYYNDKGYKIKPMYYDLRRNKVITYTLIGPDDKYIATEKLLRDVQLLYTRRFGR